MYQNNNIQSLGFRIGAGYSWLVNTNLRSRPQHMFDMDRPKPTRSSYSSSVLRNKTVPSLRIQTLKQPGPAEQNGLPDELKSESTLSIRDVTYNNVKISDIYLGHIILGSGRYGTVYPGKHIPSGTEMAVKLIRYNADPENKKEQERLLRELAVSTRSRSYPYIVNFYGSLFWDGDVWMCMEIMDTSLDKFYKTANKKNENIPEDIIGMIAFAVVHALEHLRRELEVIHRDVKPSNILINRTGEIKLCDFGISGTLVNSFVFSLDVGAKAYMAPERINPAQIEGRNFYDVRSDVWSLGITLIELAVGFYPYSTCKDMFQLLDQVVNGPPPTLPSGRYNENFEEFTRECLKQYEHRPKYDKLLQHPFIVQYKEKAVDVSGYVSHVLDSSSEMEGTQL